jgi:hypothetical protein
MKFSKLIAARGYLGLHAKRVKEGQILICSCFLAVPPIHAGMAVDFAPYHPTSGE